MSLKRLFSSPATDLLAKIVVLALLYLIAGRLAMQLSAPPGYATPIWPAAGISLGFLLSYGNRLWPGIFLGSFLTNFMVTAGQHGALDTAVFLPLSIAAGATLQALAASWLVRRWMGPEITFATPRQILLFFLPVSLLPNLISASWGLYTQYLFGVIEQAQFLQSFTDWYTGDVLGTILFTPLILIYTLRKLEVWSSRGLSVGLVMIISMVSVFLASRALVETEFLRNMGAARNAATQAEARVVANINIFYQILYDQRSFLMAEEHVNANTYGRFTTNQLETRRGIQALSFNDFVHKDERESYESRLREEGFTGFQIMERDAENNLIRAQDRDFYVSVSYIEPYSKNLPAHGFDVASNPLRRTALLRAATENRIIGTAPINLVQAENQSRQGMLAFLAVYQPTSTSGSGNLLDSIKGFAVGVFYIDEMLGTAFSQDMPPIIYRIVIHDVTDASPGTLLAAYGQSSAQPLTPGLTGNQEILESVIDVAGRQWAVRLYIDATMAGESHSLRLLIWSGQLALVFLMGFVLLLSAQAIHDAHVRQQTKQFETALRITGGISHQFNNLLAVVQGNIQRLLTNERNYTLRERFEILEDAESAGNEMAMLTRYLIIASGSYALKPVILSLQDTLEELVSTMQPELLPGCQLSIDIPNKPLQVYADSEYLVLALKNLILNACEAMLPTGGVVSVTISEAENGFVRCQVIDTGRGMSADEIRQSVEPFYSTKSGQPGHGLGLSIARGFIVESGGCMDIDSHPGEGTCVTFFLPSSRTVSNSPHSKQT